jgi:hypothetical protein
VTARLFILISILILLALSTAPESTAQVSPSTGAIQVHVTDPSGAVIVKAAIALENLATGFHRECATQTDGTCILPLLPPANHYEVHVDMAGFAKTTTNEITVRVTEVTDVNITLKVATAAQEVVVSAATETVQTSNATLGATLLKK